ncbi:MAG: SDR family oxidoreductase [Bacteroidales bacterium]|nr:SDR family oxidoreductase [Bacteroidales bacterium]
MINKTCLILGSNSDVGQATAYAFAKNGYDIILATRQISDYQKRLAADIALCNNVRTENVVFDGASHSNHKAFYESLSQKPDVVVSVFGYLGNHEKALTVFNETYTILDANLIGHISVLNIIADDMTKKRSGVIIGVSSVAGDRGRKSNYIYGCAKAGFTQYLSGLRGRMLEYNVHVISVIPGFINSKMIKGLKTPEKLTAQPEQVAKSIWRAFRKKKNVIYVLGLWRLIMFIIKMIPESIFKKLNF